MKNDQETFSNIVEQAAAHRIKLFDETRDQALDKVLDTLRSDIMKWKAQDISIGVDREYNILLRDGRLTLELYQP